MIQVRVATTIHRQWLAIQHQGAAFQGGTIKSDAGNRIALVQVTRIRAQVHRQGSIFIAFNGLHDQGAIGIPHIQG